MCMLNITLSPAGYPFCYTTMVLRNYMVLLPFNMLPVTLLLSRSISVTSGSHLLDVVKNTVTFFIIQPVHIIIIHVPLLCGSSGTTDTVKNLFTYAYEEKIINHQAYPLLRWTYPYLQYKTLTVEIFV